MLDYNNRDENGIGGLLLGLVTVAVLLAAAIFMGMNS